MHCTAGHARATSPSLNLLVGGRSSRYPVPATHHLPARQPRLHRFARGPRDWLGAAARAWQRRAHAVLCALSARCRCNTIAFVRYCSRLVTVLLNLYSRVGSQWYEVVASAAGAAAPRQSAHNGQGMAACGPNVPGLRMATPAVTTQRSPFMPDRRAAQSHL
jgi:hypothetical protein